MKSTIKKINNNYYIVYTYNKYKNELEQYRFCSSNSALFFACTIDGEL